MPRMFRYAAILAAIMSENISAACWVLVHGGVLVMRKPRFGPQTAAQNWFPSKAASVNHVSFGVSWGDGDHWFMAAAIASEMPLRMRGGVNLAVWGPWCIHWYAPAKKGWVPFPGRRAQLSFPKRRLRESLLYPDVASLDHEIMIAAIYVSPLLIVNCDPSRFLPIHVVICVGSVIDLGLIRYPISFRVWTVRDVNWDSIGGFVQYNSISSRY